MSDKTIVVLNGYLKLTDEERQEFIDAVNNFHKKSYIGRVDFVENVQKSQRMVLGPLSSTACPCCGK